MAENENETLDPRIKPLLENAYTYLANGQIDKAWFCAERIVNIDPKNAEGYLCMLLVETKCKNREQLRECTELFDMHESYQLAFRFGDKELRTFLSECLMEIMARIKERDYNEATEKMKQASIASFKEAAEIFGKLNGYKDSNEKAKECVFLAEEKRKEYVYNQAIYLKETGTKSLDMRDFQRAVDQFMTVADYKDSLQQVELCKAEMEKAKALLVTEHQKENERLFFLRKKAEEDNRTYLLRLLKTTWVYLAIIAAAVAVLAIVSAQITT